MRALMTVTMMFALGTAGSSSGPARLAMAKIVPRIQRADYEDDRKALLTLAGEMERYTKKGPLASRALYWRGFAMWRRALNGFNDSVDPKELERDLTEAVRSFTEAAAKDPEFVDARAAASICLFSLAYLNKDDAERRQAHMTRGVQLREEAEKAAPENPRVLWLRGGGEWWTPAERGGSQAKAIETYERGLELARKQKRSATDPLEPASGEPELLMTLAWAYSNRATPDIAAAESNAIAALALVPNWHYVRDILLPQIRAKATPASPAAPTGDHARKEAGPNDFDFLEGKWTIVYNNAQPGIPANLRGTWTARKQADGRVLYDEFRILGPKGETAALGTTYRVFDHVRKQWDCRFVQLIRPGAEGPEQLAQWAEFTAWPEGSTLRADQHNSRSSLRITYYDITKDHFRWKADVSTDGGNTWKADQIRIEATRAAD